MKENERECQLQVNAMLLAGDIGGTKTLLGLFEPDRVAAAPDRGPSFGTLDFPDLPSMIAAFLERGAARGAIDGAGVLRRRRTGDRRCGAA